ncbi:MAG: LysE family transporter [Bacteroidales bacterium]|nr:LysE family transporter [Bacteroidales bacterium]
MALVLKGMAAGFTISMPVGPVAVLCITRTLHKGRISGLLSGAGGTTADTIYALVAALGLTIVISFIESNRTILQIIAGIIVLFFGFRIFTTNPVTAYKNRMKEQGGLLGDYLSVLPLAFANPVSLFVYLGVFSGLSLTYSGSANAAALLMVPGVLAGSLIWWFTLSGIISRFRERIKLRTLLWINQIAGGVIVLFGLLLLIALFVT